MNNILKTTRNNIKEMLFTLITILLTSIIIQKKNNDNNLHLISVYIPESDLEIVKEIMFQAGAGKIGNYEKCAWQTLGEGQFKPLVGSNPSIGEINKVEKVKEYKVEMYCDNETLPKVIKILQETQPGHPYETIPFLIFRNSATFINKDK